MPGTQLHLPLRKRVFDVACAALALVVLFPVLLIIALVIRLRLGSPILFRQVRPGLLCRPFTIFKFRTMRHATDAQGNLLPDTQRLTPLGNFLRGTSLDELPELFNVLIGDMSLVGPRPLLVKYLPYYRAKEQLRHSVRPGITGWAQINGRNRSSWDERLAMDVWYVEHWSFRLDLKILLTTIVKVVKRDGVLVDTSGLESALDEERSGRELPSLHEGHRRAS